MHNACAAPNVAVTIPPVHSLISQVMLGVSTPKLLMKSEQSPHTSQLAPSTIRKLADAELIFWIGPNFETSLSKAIMQKTKSSQVIRLIDAKEIMTLARRANGIWRDLANQPQDITTYEQQVDQHIWLSAQNAIAIINIARDNLSKLDAQNAITYQQNAIKASENVRKLAIEISVSLKPLRTIPYLVYHDAYQYFEYELKLNAVGAISADPHQRQGLKTILAINSSINQLGIKCLFHEPQFQSRLIKRIVEQNPIKTEVLDPVGAALTPGALQWSQLVLAMRDNVVRCLQ